MSPLAQRLFRSALHDNLDRVHLYGEGISLADELMEAHCFDVSAVNDLVPDLVPHFFNDQWVLKNADRAFLPDRKTWIETTTDLPGQRLGLLLHDTGQLALCTCFLSWPDQIHLMFVSAIPLRGSLYLDGQPMRVPNKVNLDNTPAGWVESVIADIYPMLSIINTPKIIGRKQHMPHAGLQREVLNSKRPMGKYPLRAWTEIVLKATPTFVDDTGETREVFLSGRKCLHFCRAHLRVRLGRLELVSPHWRGDPALGIKRSRYKVVPA